MQAFVASDSRADLFRHASQKRGFGDIPLHIPDPFWLSAIPLWGQSSFGFVSIRRSTKGIQPQDGRTGFGAPHVKPFVRPSIFPWKPKISGKIAAFWPKRAQSSQIPAPGDKGLQVHALV
jgi:hypothetical protein